MAALLLPFARRMHILKNAGPRLAQVALLTAAIASASCWDQNPTQPSPNADNVPVMTESFNGTLPLGGSKFYSFSTTVQGTVSANLIGLKEDGADSSAQLSVSLGVPVGVACSVEVGQIVTPGAGTVLSTTLPGGVYCVQILDPGNLVSPGIFSITIAHPR
jgi:hypothetical protein